MTSSIRPLVTSFVASLLALALLSCGSEGGGGGFSVAKDVAIRVNPVQVSFGEVAVFEKRFQEVTIEHVGTEGTLRLRAVVLETESKDFRIEPPALTSLEPGEKTTFKVWYEPKDAKADTGVVRIQHNASNPGTDVLVAINALPQAGTLIVVPTPINFGTVEAATTAEIPVEVRNTGSNRLEIRSVRLRADSSEDFEITQLRDQAGEPANLPVSLDPNARMMLTARYTPRGGDSDTGTLVIETDSKDTPKHETTLMGGELGPEISISPGVIDLGCVEIGGSPAEAELRIFNKGTINLEIASITPSANSQPGLSFAPAAPLTIEPGKQETVTISFAPTQSFGVGTVNVAGIAIKSNDSDEGLEVIPVFAREQSAQLTVTPPTVVDFGFTAQTLTTTRQITLFNNAAGCKADLVVKSLSIEGDALGEFSAGSVPAAPILSGETATVDVSFTNKGAGSGTATAKLKIETNIPGIPVYTLDLVAKRADSAQCKLQISPQVGQYGIVPIGKTRDISMKVTNVGSGPCRIPPFDDPDRLRIVDCAGDLFPGLPFGSGCQPGAGPKSQSSKRFRALGAPPAMDLDPGQFITIPVRFIPPPTQSIFCESFDSCNFAALLHMKAFDPNQLDATGQPRAVYAPANAVMGGAATVDANLRASSGISDIAVIPQEVDFGVTTIGCASETITVSLYNKGNAPINVTDMKLDGCTSEFEIVKSPGLPSSLVQGAPLKVEVRFVPQDTTTDGCVLMIESDDPATPALTVPLTGTGTYDSEQTDTFVQQSGQDVDVLFVVDNSGSMSDEQKSLANNIDKFIQEAKTWSTNYRLALVSTDVKKEAGKFRSKPRWVTPQTPDGLKKFADSVKALGDNGGATEQGLEAAQLALSLPNSFLAEDANGDPVSCTNDSSCQGNGTGCFADPESFSQPKNFCGGPNWGFLRPNAAIEIVIISDEPDQGPAELSFYIDFFKSLKGFANENLMHIHAIVGDLPNGCATAAAGEGYTQASQETGGVVASICSPDYGDILGDIGKVAFGLQRQFFLSRPAQPGTITVKVKGVACSSGWQFDPPSNTVIFDENGPCMPQDGDTIEIHYETLCFQP